MYRQFGKRFLDLFVATLGFILISPMFLTILLLLVILNKGKPFFIQIRTGRNERSFKILKFKTMTDALDEHGNLLPVEKRLTTVGDLIRKTSMDELPQLINVLKGDMSLIGPRPLLPKYLDFYTKDELRRHNVRPGITGLAQVSGRNFLSWDKKLEKDVEYVNDYSLLMDLKILGSTIGKVLFARDIATNSNLIYPPLDIERSKKK